MLSISVLFVACGGGGNDDVPEIDTPLTNIGETTNPLDNLTTAISITFSDKDIHAAELAGDIHVERAADESNINHYLLVWGDSAGQALSNLEPIKQIDTADLQTPSFTYVLPNNTLIPDNATQILVVSSQNQELTGVSIGTSFEDVVVTQLMPPIKASWQDTVGEVNHIGGELSVMRATEETYITGYVVLFVDADSNPLENQPVIAAYDLATSAQDKSTTDQANFLTIVLPNTAIPPLATGIMVTTTNYDALQTTGPIIPLLDWQSNAQLIGDGGNVKTGRIRYGESIYPALDVQRYAQGDGFECVLDNGLVAVIDMQNTTDPNIDPFSSLQGDTLNNLHIIEPLAEFIKANQEVTQIDDEKYPAFRYDCDTSNEFVEAESNGGYSPLKDAFFFGNITHQMFMEYLGIPPLAQKMRLRVHYGSNFDNAFWDGNYANFGDGNIFFHPMTVLDVVAHEVAHGFVERFSGLPSTKEGGAINEAFADMAGEAAEYYFFQKYTEDQTNDWVHNFNAWQVPNQALRYFSRPHVDGRSLNSYRDYQNGTGAHYGSGIFNKAFYLLADPLSLHDNRLTWSTAEAFQAFALANQFCWHPETNLVTGAACVFDQAENIASLRDSACLVAPQSVTCVELVNAIRHDIHQALAGVDLPQSMMQGLHASFQYINSSLLTVNFTDTSQVEANTTITAWRWQLEREERTNEQITYIPVFTSQEANPQFLVDQGGYYRMRLSITDSQGQQDSFARELFIQENYCAVRSSSDNAEINRVALGESQKLSSYDGYADFTDHHFYISSVDALVPLVLEANMVEPKALFWQVWIDFNRDGDFEDEGEKLLPSDVQGLQVNLELDLAQATAGEPLRMRVGVGQVNNLTDSCGSVTGEIEDYSLLIEPRPIATQLNFEATSNNLNVSFKNLSFSSSNMIWKWDLGDGQEFTGDNPIHSYAQTGKYRVTLKAINPDNDQVLTSLTKTISATLFESDTEGYCLISSTQFGYEAINSVTINDYPANISGTPTQGYSNFTSQAFTVNNNQPINLILEPWFGGSQSSEYWRVWVDWNDNQVFEAEELMVDEIVDHTNVEVLVTSITVPDNTSLGDKRMRVVIRYPNTQSERNTPVACGDFGDDYSGQDGGEAEDYMLRLVAP
ncbi:MAG: GEVED domain-containing protein [Pseudomonadota bacterium]